MFFFLEETGGVKPLLIIYVNKKYKGVYKEKAHININCGFHSTVNAKLLVSWKQIVVGDKFTWFGVGMS